MDAKLFKNVTTYLNVAPNKPSNRMLDKLMNHETEDPSGGQWRTMGFVAIELDKFWIDVQGAARLCLLQLNERILPGAVQKEKMLERIVKLEEDQGRKVSKKDYAMIRDDIALELLPKAFIRRKLVPIMFRGDRVYIFTSSARVADDAATLLVATVGNDSNLVLAHLNGAVTLEPSDVLTSLAKQDIDINGDMPFEAAFGAVLKGADKKAIRIKDVDINGDDVSRLLEQDYYVTQLDVAWYTDDVDTDPQAKLTINDKLIISKLVLEGIKPLEKGADDAERMDSFIGGAWLTATTLDQIVDNLIDELGGLKKSEAPEVDEDDDL